MSGDLEAMLKRAAQHKITPAEEHAQRRSWVIGQMMLSHPEMTREEAERLADGAVGPNHAARVAELEAENARLADQLADATRDLLASDEANEGLEEKLRALAPHGSCACSYDRPGNVCMHHSPKLAAVEADLADALAQNEILRKAKAGLAAGWAGIDGLCIRSPAPHAAPPAEPTARTVTINRSHPAPVPTAGEEG